jgi:hypothetical protein
VNEEGQDADASDDDRRQDDQENSGHAAGFGTHLGLRCEE